MKNFILILTIILTNSIFTYFIMQQIEKHSVHPEFGNYCKVTSYGRKCQPWDDCR